MWAIIKRMIAKYRQFILYCIFGCMNTLIDFLVFTATNELAHLPIELCQVCGYMGGFISGFVFNRNVTFKKEGSTGLFTQILRFVLVNLVSLTVSTVLIRWLENIGVNDYVAKVMVQVIVVLINYFGYKLYVFRAEGKKRGDGEKKEENR